MTPSVILSPKGEMLDGVHRVAKALLEGNEHIEAVRFDRDPEEDHVGIRPTDLPYDDEPT